MSRWSDHLEALRSVAKKRPKLNAPSIKTPAFMSRTTIWIDGRHARTFGGAPMPLSSANDVAAALKAIETLAPKPANLGLHALRVVVGAPFARYHALPWQPLPKPQDWVAAARVQAVQMGAGTEAWRYAVTDGAWEQGRLAAAISEALCASIERLCKTRKLQLLGIEPAYTFAMQKHAARIRDGAIAIVALEETERDAAIAHIGLRRGGGWTAFIALPVTRTREGALDGVLRDAFALCADTPPERRYVIGPGGPGGPDARERWSADAALVEWLPAPWDAAT
ncbi:MULTISPECIES: hypothetical protein [unclassified Caballeronia]|uniref:hypothetical protein n=1 Tax=unclassified Caballeronia TaxID=2646786 RepID=UPI002027A260|nr:MULTISPECIES: hypothetical protein [unclassified Caballeronia]MDR5788029.1 hypothetical protein [Caballeronia sp. LP003]